MRKTKFALVSTFNKTNLDVLCKNFEKNNISIISTGSTSDHIRNLGFKCEEVSSLTKFKEILDGRVKTLHPKIHASLLYKRENKQHVSTFKTMKFPSISFVIVNLYPFSEVIKKNKNKEECIEMIDIGGPTLLRSAAKNFKNVTSICSPKYYNEFINNLNNNYGCTSLDFRKKMAQHVFETTYNYDLSISNWFLNIKQDEHMFKNMINEDLRYGENPNQKASVYYSKSRESIFKNILQGKKISYNNILDTEAALNCLNEFSENACVIIKHSNPCGVALGKNNKESFIRALSCDPQSAFGGIVAFNKPVNEDLAKLLKNYFFEIIIAKKFYTKSVEILKLKKNLILIESKNIKIYPGYEIKTINNGYLKQEKNIKKINIKKINCVSKKKATQRHLKDLLFAFKVCKHVKSNAIVLARNVTTIGIGAGQMSRIDATKIAISKVGNKKQSFVAASDAFFPFNDNVKLLIKNNCNSIIQPKGSINDKSLIKLSNNRKISLYFSDYRLFKH